MTNQLTFILLFIIVACSEGQVENNKSLSSQVQDLNDEGLDLEANNTRKFWEQRNVKKSTADFRKSNRLIRYKKDRVTVHDLDTAFALTLNCKRGSIEVLLDGDSLGTCDNERKLEFSNDSGGELTIKGSSNNSSLVYGVTLTEEAGEQNNKARESNPPRKTQAPTNNDGGDKKGSGNTVNYVAPRPYDYPSDYNNKSKSETIPNRHLLVWQENPANEILISWGVDKFNGDGNHKVYLSKSQHNGKNPAANYELQFNAKESGLLDACGDDDPHANLQAKITGLEPNTTYFYITESNGQKSREMHFVTAPASSDVSFRFLAGGDSRSDRDQRRVMNRTMARMVAAEPSYLGLVHGGDFITNGANCGQWKEWRDDHQSTISKNGRAIPVVATFGNHEEGGEDQYYAIFGDPLRSRANKPQKFYFVSTIGNMSLIVLNSQISVTGDQQDWLNDTLDKLKSKKDHVIVAGYHRPAWPSVKNPGDTTAWIDEFEAFQVNLVLESDGHVLKQTCPIYENQCDDKNGIVYVGEGGLGVKQRDPADNDVVRKRFGFNPFASKDGGYQFKQHHVQSLEISPNGGNPSVLTYKVYYDGGYNHKIDLPSKDRSKLGK